MEEIRLREIESSYGTHNGFLSLGGRGTNARWCWRLHRSGEVFDPEADLLPGGASGLAAR